MLLPFLDLYVFCLRATLLCLRVDKLRVGEGGRGGHHRSGQKVTSAYLETKEIIIFIVIIFENLYL